jgi:hypothetical protein
VIAVGRTSVSGWVTAPFVLVPSDGVFGHFDLAALRGCHTFKKFVCLFVLGGWLVAHYQVENREYLISTCQESVNPDCKATVIYQISSSGNSNVAE